MNSKGWLTCAGLAVAPWVARAQETAASQTSEQAMTLMEMIQAGGWPMYLLGVLSVAAVAFIIYFLAVFRAEAIVPREFLLDVRQMLKNRRLEEADIACRKNESPLAAVVLSAIEYIQGASRPDAGMLKEVMEGEGGRQAGIIQNQTQYLLDVGVIAPMVGLLGTVLGMLKAFNSVALDIAKAKPMVLAAGVSQALITTAVGLLIAVPAMIFYAYFRGRTARLIARLESVSAEFMNILSDHCSS